MIIKKPSFQDVVSGCYEAAWDDSLWPQALTNICDYLKSPCVTLESSSQSSGQLTGFQSARIDPQSVADYANYFHTINPRNTLLLQSRQGDVLYDSKVLSNKQMEQSEFYNDLLMPYGLRYFMANTLISNSDQLVFLASHRSIQQGHADKNDVAAINAIAPFVRQARSLSDRIGSLSQNLEIYSRALHVLDEGVLILDASARVHFVNRKAERLIQNNSTLFLSQRGVRFSEKKSENRLFTALTNTLSSDITVPDKPFLISSEDADHSLIIQISPLHSADKIRDALSLSLRKRYAMVQVKKAVASFNLPQELLTERFGLTPKEYELAQALVAGMSFEQFAARNRVSMTTVRTHYANLRGKMGARNQADVIRSLAPFICD